MTDSPINPLLQHSRQSVSAPLPTSHLEFSWLVVRATQCVQLLSPAFNRGSLSLVFSPWVSTVRTKGSEGRHERFPEGRLKHRHGHLATQHLFLQNNSTIAHTHDRADAGDACVRQEQGKRDATRDCRCWRENTSPPMPFVSPRSKRTRTAEDECRLDANW